jgi:hypothetical protein
VRSRPPPTCAQPEERGRTSVDGNPARLLVYPRCDGNYTLWIPLLHNRQAFIIWWLSDPGSESEDRAAFEKALETFRFSS